MTSKLQVDNLEGRTTKGSITVTGESNGASTNLQQGLAKNWVFFDGTGTIAIADSFNCASLTDAGTGDYENNLTNAIASTSYMAITCSGHFHSVDGGHNSSSTYSLEVYGTSHSAADVGRCSMGLYGDLA
jgi:hypothetical protein